MEANKRKVVWIIGASSGIGEGIARRFAAQGHVVCVSARREAPLRQLADEFETVEVHLLDASDHKNAKQVATKIIGNHQKIDLVVYAAVLAGTEKEGASAIEEAMHIGTIGAAHALEPVIASMKEHRRGQIALIGSPVAYDALPGTMRYGTDKASLHYFTRSLRLALEPYGVDVKLVLPGFVRTPLTDRNNFDMPFLMELEPAIDRIIVGLNNPRRATVAFPKRLHLLMRLIGLLPDRLYFWLFGRIQRKIYSRSG